MNEEIELWNQLPFGVVVVDSERRVLRYTPRAAEVFRLSPAAIGMELSRIPSSLREVDLLQLIALAQSAPNAIQTTVQDSEGRIISLFVAPYTADETVGGAIVATAEITFLGQDNAAVLRELDHRVKNVLHNILSIAKQTVKRAASQEEFLASFQGRVLAFAQLHRLLAKSAWHGALLSDLLRMMLEPHTGIDGPSIELKGPSVHLTNGQTQSLCLALHELAANAHRYGAFSAPQGLVTVEWSLSDHQAVTVNWSERSGPEVKAPGLPGFGSKLVQMILQHELKGSVVFQFPPGGARIELSFPLKYVY